MKKEKSEHDYSKELEQLFWKHKLGCSYEFQVHGAAVTRYVFSPNKGTTVSTFLKRADKIVAELPVEKVRIFAPVSEFEAIGVEVPNFNRENICFEEMVSGLMNSKGRLPIILGRTVEGFDYLVDLVDAPHILIAGKPGSGKTMLLHSIIGSLVVDTNPKELKFIIAQADGKNDLSMYEGFEYLDRPVLKTADDVFRTLEELAEETERRIHLFFEIGVQRIEDFNKRSDAVLPSIIVIIDEIADIVSADSNKFDELIKRLSAVGKPLGLHLILTTREPHADVISLAVWSCLPTEIALEMPSQLSSQLVTGFSGGEKLLGKGDMLYYKRNMTLPIRIQGALCPIG